MPEQNKADSFNFVFSWRRLLLHCTIICVGLFLGLLSWYISKPQATRFYETSAEQHQNIKIMPHVQIFLGMNSAVAVTDNQPLQIELFKGNAYFDTSERRTNEIEVKVEKALIKNVGTRFRINMHADGSSSNIKVVEGKIEIYVASGTYQVNAGEQADFNGLSVYEHKLITETDSKSWNAE